MTIDEQKRIAFDQGRLAAVLGQIHRPPAYVFSNTLLMSEWGRGVSAQCKTMSDAAAKVPLLFADEKA